VLNRQVHKEASFKVGCFVCEKQRGVWLSATTENKKWIPKNPWLGFMEAQRN
jgi:hypothetical protein